MESFSCNTTKVNGIKLMKSLGEMPMNKAKTLLLTSALTISGLFAAQAQTSANDDKLIALNNPEKTEVVTGTKLDNPVRNGDYVDAERLSALNNLLVIHIYGGKGKTGQPEPLTAQQYAERLVAGFKDKQYTKYPMDIAVVYEESGKNRITTGMVLINGDEYETPKGRTVFTPIQIADNMDLFTTKYMQANGLATLDSDSPSIVSNEPN